MCACYAALLNFSVCTYALSTVGDFNFARLTKTAIPLHPPRHVGMREALLRIRIPSILSNNSYTLRKWKWERHVHIASSPGLRGEGEGRPGTHCMRMRRVSP